MMGEQPADFAQATEITMQAYRQIASDYADRHQTSRQPSFWQENMLSFMSHIQADQQQQVSLPLLDAGCGPGRDALLFAQAGYEVLAIDLSAAMLAEARLRCLSQPGSKNIQFRQADMRHLDLPDASCSGIWASASFLHIPKQENSSVLQELTRVLVSEGPLMLIVKEVDSGPDERYDPTTTGDQVRFFARYRGGELWELLEKVGLRVLSITTAPDKRFANQQRWLAALALKPRVE